MEKKHTIYDVNKDLEVIAALYSLSFKHALTVEVFWSALTYMKDNPSTTIEDACNFAASQWDL